MFSEPLTVIITVKKPIPIYNVDDVLELTQYPGKLFAVTRKESLGGGQVSYTLVDVEAEDAAH